jgi:hypothetical protein
VVQHLAHHVEVAVVVVEDREVDQVAAVAFGEVVVQRLQRAAAAAMRARAPKLACTGGS